MQGYYSEKLSGDRLRKCYELAPVRIKQYLEAEIKFVMNHLRATDSILELGCGYGRVAFRLAEVARNVIGIDTAPESLKLARQLAGQSLECEFLQMNASALAFSDAQFDVVVCVQNGICAFAVDAEQLVKEALRVIRPGGRAIFSTYWPKFWPERLQWFKAQAAAGLVGELDDDQTRDGTIVCKDGFRVGTYSSEDFRSLTEKFNLTPVITTVDDSSLFCEFILPKTAQSHIY